MAANVADPDKPVPDVFIVNVPFAISDVNANVPLVAGIVSTVPTPAAAGGVSCAVPDVAPGKVMLLMPVNA